MAEKIHSDGFKSCLDEEVGGGEVTPEGPQKQPSVADRALQVWNDGVETARDAARSVRDAARALDLEGNIEALGPGDSMEVKVSGGGKLGISAGAAAGFDVRRLQDGRYQVSGAAELNAGYGHSVSFGVEALKELGVEQAGSARVELTVETPQEAAAAVRALRDTALRQSGLPIPGADKDLALIGMSLTAIEVGVKTAAQAEGGLKVLGAGLELKAGISAEQSVRFESGKQGDEVVLKTALTADAGAPLKLGGLLPHTSSALPPSVSLSLGQPLKGAMKVETETRLKLEGDLKTALRGAKTTVTFGVEAKATALFKGAGREAKVSFEVTGAQAQAAVEAVALREPQKLAPVLSAEATLEAKAFREKGGEASTGISAGSIGGYVGLDARLRDVDEQGTLKIKATAGELLRWLASE